MPGEAPVTLSLNVLDAMDVTSGKGVVFVRIAPLPHARSDKRPDFRVVAGRPHAVEVLPSAYRCERIPMLGDDALVGADAWHRQFDEQHPELKRDICGNFVDPRAGQITSLNLSNAVAIVLYEALRQLAYPGMA